MMSYCLVPVPVLELQTLIGKDFVSNFQTEMDSYLAPYRKNVSKGRPLSMGKELWEYAVADSITGAEWCGAGKGIADVSISDTIKCDVKSIQIIKKTTTEASMYQPLTSQEDASGYFKVKDKQSLWNLFVNGWLKKVSEIDEYYMLAIFRDENLNCSLAGFKVSNRELIFSEENCEFTKKSMKIKSIIDNTLANIKAYLGKTRLEIRITDKVFNDPSYTMRIYTY